MSLRPSDQVELQQEIIKLAEAAYGPDAPTESRDLAEQQFKSFLDRYCCPLSHSADTYLTLLSEQLSSSYYQLSPASSRLANFPTTSVPTFYGSCHPCLSAPEVSATPSSSSSRCTPRRNAQHPLPTNPPPPPAKMATPRPAKARPSPLPP